MVSILFASSDWNATDYRFKGEVPIPPEDYKLVLPLVLQYLTPLPVAIIGLGAVSAAVMSSVDSSMLSASSQFVRHVYLPVRNVCSTKRGGEKYQVGRYVLIDIRSTISRAPWLRGRALDSRLRGPGFESCAAVLKPWQVSFTLHCSSSLSCVNEYLAIDFGGYVYEQPSHINCSIWLNASQRS